MQIKMTCDTTVLKAYSTYDGKRMLTDILETDERTVGNGDVLSVFTEYPEYYIANLNGEAVIVSKTESEVI